jgi:hypothetical protein
MWLDILHSTHTPTLKATLKKVYELPELSASTKLVRTVLNIFIHFIEASSFLHAEQTVVSGFLPLSLFQTTKNSL